MLTSSSCQVSTGCEGRVGAGGAPPHPNSPQQLQHWAPSPAGATSSASAPIPPAGQDLYRNLPSKTLQLLKYALSSDCQYTHIMKVDDDVYLRPQVRGQGGEPGQESGRGCWMRLLAGPRGAGAPGCAIVLCCRLVANSPLHPCLPARLAGLPCLQMLMDIITQGHYNFSVGGAYSGPGGRWVPAIAAPAQQRSKQLRMRELQSPRRPLLLPACAHPLCPVLACLNPPLQASLTASQPPTFSRPGWLACMWASWTA